MELIALKQKQYKKKDKKAQIFKTVQSRNERGDSIEIYQPLSEKSLWCYTENLHGYITNNQLVVENEEERIFCFNHIEGIQQGYKILYRDNYYEITRVYSEGDYKTEIFCYTKKIDK